MYYTYLQTRKICFHSVWVQWTNWSIHLMGLIWSIQRLLQNLPLIAWYTQTCCYRNTAYMQYQQYPFPFLCNHMYILFISVQYNGQQNMERIVASPAVVATQGQQIHSGCTMVYRFNIIWYILIYFILFWVLYIFLLNLMI